MINTARPDVSMELLSAVLSVLIPGDDDFPSAGSTAICDAMMADAAIDGESNLVVSTLSKLPTAFEVQDERTKVSVLKKLELSEPKGFAALVRHAYHAYYTAQEVREVIESLDGYPARPPHYAGYELEAFDVKSLDAQKKRQPFWRNA